jgi:hypothetical protein
LQELLRAPRVCHQSWVIWTPWDNFHRNFLSRDFFHRRNHLLHRRTLSGTQIHGKRRISRLQVLQRLHVRFG